MCGISLYLVEYVAQQHATMKLSSSFINYFITSLALHWTLLAHPNLTLGYIQTGSSSVFSRLITVTHIHEAPSALPALQPL